MEVGNGYILEGNEPTLPKVSESKILEGRNQSPAKDCRISTESELRKEIGPLQKTPGSETAIIRDCIEREVDLSTGTLEQGSGELKRLYSLMPVMEIQDGILKVRMQVNNRNTVHSGLCNPPQYWGQWIA